MCLKIGLEIRDSFFSSIFFPSFGRDFGCSKKFDARPICYEAIRNSWEGIVSDDFLLILWIIDFEWPCLPEGETPKDMDNLKIVIHSMNIFILKLHERCETSKFFFGGAMVFSDE